MNMFLMLCTLLICNLVYPAEDEKQNPEPKGLWFETWPILQPGALDMDH